MQQANNLRLWRKWRGWTVEHVADLAEVDKSTISRYESGGIGYTKRTLAKIAKAYGVGAADLLSPPPTDNNPDEVMRLLFATLTHEQKLQAIRTIRAMF